MLEHLATARAQRSAERRQLGDVIDLVQLRTSESHAEILRLVEDAAAEGDEIGEAARAIGIARLRKLTSSREARQQLTSPEFVAVCRLSAIQAQKGGTSRVDTEARFAAKKKAIRSAVLAVANLIGVGPEFTRGTVAAAITAPPVEARGGLIFGTFWGRQTQGRR